MQKYFSLLWPAGYKGKKKLSVFVVSGFLSCISKAKAPSLLRLDAVKPFQNCLFGLCKRAPYREHWKVEQSFLLWWEKFSLNDSVGFHCCWQDKEIPLEMYSTWQSRERGHHSASCFNGTMGLQVGQGCQMVAHCVEMWQWASFMIEGPRLWTWLDLSTGCCCS